MGRQHAECAKTAANDAHGRHLTGDIEAEHADGKPYSADVNAKYVHCG
jgi:hypothetical protein